MLIGKTNLPELAIWPFTETETWGETRNPWNTDRSAGGSSGGSGAAVAAGLVGAASASDGGGSIRIPAAQLRPLRPEATARTDQPDARARALARAVGDRLRQPPRHRHGALARCRRRRRARATPTRRRRPSGPRSRPPPRHRDRCGSRWR